MNVLTLKKANELTRDIEMLQKHRTILQGNKGFRRAFFPYPDEETHGGWSGSGGVDFPLALSIKTHTGVQLFDEFFGNLAEVEVLYMIRLDKKILDLESELEEL